MRFLVASVKITSYVLAGMLLVDPTFLLRAELKDKISDVRAQVSGDNVIVEYDLLDSRTAEYEVKISLRRRSNPFFEYIPKNVSGDVGPRVLGGNGKRITWGIAREFPGGLSEDDYYFTVTAELTAPKEFPWLIVGGAFLAAGVATALIILKKGQETSEPKGGFPFPPGRP